MNDLLQDLLIRYNSASADDVATMACCVAQDLITCAPLVRTPPETDRLVDRSPAQSESEYPINCAPGCCHLNRILALGLHSRNLPMRFSR